MKYQPLLSFQMSSSAFMIGSLNLSVPIVCLIWVFVRGYPYLNSHNFHFWAILPQLLHVVAWLTSCLICGTALIMWPPHDNCFMINPPKKKQNKKKQKNKRLAHLVGSEDKVWLLLWIHLSFVQIVYCKVWIVIIEAYWIWQGETEKKKNCEIWLGS